MSHWQIGDISIHRVLEYEGPLIAPQILLPGATEERIDRHRSWLEPTLLDRATGNLVLAFHSLVIRTPRHTVLVDTCGGNDKHRPRKERYHLKDHPYLDNLRAAGFQPEQIDVVLCTHLHVDHVGWNTRLLDGRWVPTFPNARYLFARNELTFWQSHYATQAFTDDPYYEDSILPVIEAGLSEVVDGDYAIDDWVRLAPTPGHTPGHVCVEVASRGARAVLSGDLMHHPLQCAEPDWSSCFCVDAEHSRRTRRDFLAEHADSGALVLPAHFPTPTAGRIVPAGNTWRFEFDREA
jgi:glyoxylase-like metal-dependent hydrolase (beta-lactamase superfamily II)